MVVASPLRRTFAEEKSATLARAISQSLAERPLSKGPPNGLESLEAELVRHLNDGNAALPAVPAVAIAGLRMAYLPNVNLSSLAQFVEQDPFTAARFLAVANSALYYRGFRTASVRDALMRMGMSQVREILASLAHGVMLPKYQELLVAHTERATIAGRCALAVNAELRLNYDTAYLCGLLHNLGEARVLRILADLPSPHDGPRVVHELVERYHAHAGAQLAEKWNLHSDIVQACALHHDEQHAESRPVQIAMLSDLFAELSTRPYKRPTSEHAARWKRLGVSDGQADAILRAVREQLP
ncbi:MAG: HDOD domain-containing protein [Polyangiales bacterium]